MGLRRPHCDNAGNADGRRRCHHDYRRRDEASGSRSGRAPGCGAEAAHNPLTTAPAATKWAALAPTLAWRR